MQTVRGGTGGGVGMRSLMLICLGIILLGSGCLAQLKQSKPIITNKDYEKQLLGNSAADYVGNDTCMKKCHVHEKIWHDFEASTMGAQLKISSGGMMIVDCESCHGPGSEALADIETNKLNPEKPDDPPASPEKRAKIKEIMQKNFLDFNKLPGPVRSQICLKCHTANATFNLHNWNSSSHAINNVSCSNCHPIHATGPSIIQHPEAINKGCMDCHKEVAAEFSLPSHHPNKENKIYCIDCHEPHGTTNDKLLRGMTVKETCARCHTEKAGPFLFEHGDVTEDCMNCHFSHGSVNDNLLRQKEPFLCRQCHPQHPVTGTLAGSRIERNTRCSDCHSQLHGTDTPDSKNEGVRWLQ